MSPNIRPEGHRQRTSSAPLMFIDGDSAFVRANKALGENEMDRKCASSYYTLATTKMGQFIIWEEEAGEET